MGATSHLVMMPAFQFYVEKEFNQMLLLTGSWLLWAILILPFKRSALTAQSLKDIFRVEQKVGVSSIQDTLKLRGVICISKAFQPGIALHS